MLLLSGCVARPVPQANPYDVMAPVVNAVETNATSPIPPPAPTGIMAWRSFPVIKQLLDVFDIVVHGILGDSGWLYAGAIVIILLIIFGAPRWAGVTLVLLILVFLVRMYLSK